MEVIGSKESQFKVAASCSSSSGWRVTICDKRLGETTNTEHLDEDDAESGDPDDGVERDADGPDDDDDHKESSKRKHICQLPCTPIKACWLLPFINDNILYSPNMSNREMKNLLKDYVRAKFLTVALLQNA